MEPKESGRIMTEDEYRARVEAAERYNQTDRKRGERKLPGPPPDINDFIYKLSGEMEKMVPKVEAVAKHADELPDTVRRAYLRKFLLEANRLAKALSVVTASDLRWDAARGTRK